MDLSAFTGWLTEERVTLAIALALNVVYAIVILILALAIAGWVKRRIEALSKSYPRLDATLFGFLGNLVRYLILAMAAIFVLGRFGIQTTSLVALIGAAGLAIGLALQGTLSNLASGVMLILFRPFRVGDYIEAGSEAGTVVEISLFYTELRSYDGLQLIIPNSDIWSSSIKNYSANATRLVDLTIGVSYDSDLKRAEEVLAGIAASDPRVLADPEPFIKVKELGDSSVNFVFRVWSARSDWWALKCDLNRAIKDAFDEAGVGIPFPTQTVIYDGGKTEPPAGLRTN
ncbi:mechanosensitive ion channel family protein [Phaeovulum sp. W22_SRMD_FR3]|uniref:mechanosensitive ion channel family protein n=1 Tax=Phaeovulum sp. W22_SRMD_FR3 TaxID=3240274 RepID=UPI003F9A30B4